MTFEEWKRANKSNLTQDIVDILNFERENPHIAKQYKERMEAEAKKRSEIAEIKDRAERRNAIAANMSVFE